MDKLSLRNRVIFLPAAIALASTGRYDYKAEAPPPEVRPRCETLATLEIYIGTPGWLAGVSGDSGVKGVVVSSNVSFDHAR